MFLVCRKYEERFLFENTRKLKSEDSFDAGLKQKKDGGEK